MKRAILAARINISDCYHPRQSRITLRLRRDSAGLYWACAASPDNPIEYSISGRDNPDVESAKAELIAMYSSPKWNLRVKWLH